jgi:hypothetical protein
MWYQLFKVFDGRSLQTLATVNIHDIIYAPMMNLHENKNETAGPSGRMEVARPRSASAIRPTSRGIANNGPNYSKPIGRSNTPTAIRPKSSSGSAGHADDVSVHSAATSRSGGGNSTGLIKKSLASTSTYFETNAVAR